MVKRAQFQSCFFLQWRHIRLLCLLGLSLLAQSNLQAKQQPENPQPATLTDPALSDALAQRSCMAQFALNQPPVILDTRDSQAQYDLCYAQFAVAYSGIRKTPIWVAEYLTPQRLARRVKRENVYHEEPRLPTKHQAWLRDYRQSGFDRGHMAASGNMGTRAAQMQSFSLANTVPQHRENNQNVWRDLEEATRALVSKQRLEVYVITGPLYEGSEISKIGRGVWVPTALFKVLYIPKLNIATAYVSPNNASQQVQLSSVCALEQRVGIALLPQVQPAFKLQVYALPLTANQVKKNQSIDLIYTDTESDCPIATPSARQAVQQRFAQANMPIEPAELGEPNPSQQASPHTVDETLDENSALSETFWRRLFDWFWYALVRLISAL